jgi:hypothetical protein
MASFSVFTFSCFDDAFSCHCLVFVGCIIETFVFHNTNLPS